MPGYGPDRKELLFLKVNITIADDSLKLIDKSLDFAVFPGISPIRFDPQRQLSGNLYRTKVESGSDAKVFRSIANALVYYATTNDGGLKKITSKAALGTLDIMVDFETSTLYYCREIARSLKDTEIKVKCKAMHILQPKEVPEIDRVIQFEFKYGRLVASYLKNNKTDEGKDADPWFCVAHVVLKTAEWDHRCFERLSEAAVNRTRIIVGDNYTYVLAEFTKSSGVYKLENDTKWSMVDKIFDHPFTSISYHLNLKSRVLKYDCQITLATYDRYLNMELEGGASTFNWSIKETHDSGFQPKFSCSNGKKLPFYASDSKTMMINSFYETIVQSTSKRGASYRINGLDCIDDINEAVRISDSKGFHGIYEISNGEEGINLRNVRSEVVEIPPDLGDHGFFTLSQAYFWNSTAREVANLDFDSEAWYVNWTGKQEAVAVEATATDIYNDQNKLAFKLNFKNTSRGDASASKFPKQVSAATNITKVEDNKYNLSYSILSAARTGHFWSAKLQKGQEATLSVVQRFSKVDQFKFGLNVSTAYARFEDVEAFYYNQTIVVLKNGSIVGTMVYKRYAVTEFLSLYRMPDDKTKFRISIRGDNIGHQTIDLFTFIFTKEGVESSNEAYGGDWSLLSYDSLEFELTAWGYDTMLGYIEKRYNRALNINSTRCPNTVLFLVPSTQSFALIQSPDTEGLGRRSLLVYSVIGESSLKAFSIDMKSCAYEPVTGFAVNSDILLTLSKMECKFGYKTGVKNSSFRCVFASHKEIRLQDYELTSNTTVVLKHDDDYVTYANIEVDHIQFSRPNTTDPEFFLIRGSRYVDFDANPEAALRSHDSEGILFYKLKQYGGNGYASGGFDLDDFIGLGVTSDYRMYLTSDNLVMLAGARETVFLDITEPALIGANLTESQLKQGFKLMLNTYDQSEVLITSEGYDFGSNQKPALLGFAILLGGLLVCVIPLVLLFKAGRKPVYDDLTKSMIDRTVEPHGVTISLSDKTLPQDNDL